MYRRIYEARKVMTPDIASLLDDDSCYENCHLLRQWKDLYTKQDSASTLFAIDISIWERLIINATFIANTNFLLTVDAIEMIATFMEHHVLQLLSCANQHAACRGSVMLTMKDIENARKTLKI